MKIPENVSLKGLKLKNLFNLKPIVAVFPLFMLVFVLSFSVSAVEVTKNLPFLALNGASSLDHLFFGKPIVIIRSCKNNKVLDLPGGSKSENSPIIFYEANGGPNQLWIIEKVEKGYIIRSSFSKKVLAVNTEFSKEYSLIVQQDYSGKDSQVWLISGTADSLMILNKSIKKYLAISQNYLITENYSGSLSQVWKFQFMREAQNATVTCDCPKNFEYIRNLIETSYPGFQDKVNLQTKAQYGQLRRRMAGKAGATKNTAACFKIIDQYLAFFNDNHIQFWMDDIHEYGYGEKLDPNKIRQFYATSETVKMIENEVKKYLDTNRGKLDRVEGVWQTQDGANRCAIIRDPKEMNSKENIIALEQQDKDNSRSDSRGLIKRMKENPGKFLDRSADGLVKFNTVLTNPRKIAILINKYCGSSAEEFLLRAKESKKVMMLGQPTSGTLDYSNIIPHKFPNLTYKLKLPLSRTRRTYLVDKEKIKPDFYLTDDQNWIAVAVKYLKRARE